MGQALLITIRYYRNVSKKEIYVPSIVHIYMPSKSPFIAFRLIIMHLLNKCLLTLAIATQVVPATVLRLLHLKPSGVHDPPIFYVSRLFLSQDTVF
jgi:hypothetical protein